MNNLYPNNTPFAMPCAFWFCFINFVEICHYLLLLILDIYTYISWTYYTYYISDTSSSHRIFRVSLDTSCSSDNICRCDQQTIECSSKGLINIPTFNITGYNINISSINLRYNALSVVRNYDFLSLANVSAPCVYFIFRRLWTNATVKCNVSKTSIEWKVHFLWILFVISPILL